jgi:RDD domain containing protein
MSKIQIKTTQNILLAFQPASLGERMTAFAIDFVLIMGYGFLANKVFMEIFPHSSFSLEEGIAIYSLLMLPAAFYPLVAESLMQGQTIGKRIMKIRVLKIDGYQASFADFFIRWAFGLFELDLFIGSIGIISIISTQHSQRLGDIAAGTAVITERNKLNISHTILEELSLAYQPLFSQTEVLLFSDRDVQTIKNYFTQALKSKNGEAIIQRLADKITEVSKREHTIYPQKTAFIQQFLKDYNFYTRG